MKINHYNYVKLDNMYFLTLDSGNSIFLSESEFTNFQNNVLSDELHDKLYRNFFILDKNNEANYINNLRIRYAHLYQGPSLHIVAVTNHCNLACSYCHAQPLPFDSKNLQSMDKETAKKVVNFIFQTKSNNVSIEFQGGEPLLNFDTVRYIIEQGKELNKIHKKNLLFSVVSNLTKMDDDILKYLIKNNVGICTSLDGPKPIHNKNRRYFGSMNGSYDDVSYWINRIKKEYQYEVNALLVTTRFSLPHPEDIVLEYARQGLQNIHLKFLSRLGFAEKSFDKIGYTPEEYYQFWKIAHMAITDLNKDGYLLREILTNNILKKIKVLPTYYTDLDSPCGGITGQLAYNYQGNVYTCDEGRQFDFFKIGEVNKHMQEIITSNNSCDFISSSVNNNYICDNCAFNPFCGVCPVLNYSETKNPVPHLYNNFRCKTFKYVFKDILMKYHFSALHKKIYDSWLR